MGKEEQWLLFPGAIGFVLFPAVCAGLLGEARSV